MKIFDSHLGAKVEFEPVSGGMDVGFYVCGPTVYDSAHLGHGRSAVSFDVMRRYFIYKGFNVKYVSNYTDIDDKMINRAKEEGITVSELAAKVIPEYERDYGLLNILKPDVQPLATEHIEEMVDIINLLEEGGYTYMISDGVYFDIAKFPAYGEFSGQNLDELQMGSRVEVKDEKRNPQDFVLWKLKKEGEPFWASPWGDGRPGWHIECSAMSRKHLGDTFDIHGGGLDLKFPHHECEVAQSVCALGAGTFSKYWMHNGFIQVDNEKMSKSLGNFFTLKDIFKKYDPQVVRFMFLQTHYRNPINFSDVLLDQAKAGLTRIHDFVRRLKVGYDDLPNSWSDIFLDRARLTVPTVDELKKQFEEFMDNDFDVSGALGVVFNVISTVNSLRSSNKLTKQELNFAEEFLVSVDSVLGVIFPKGQNEKNSEDVEKLIVQREDARKNKDFARSDEIRDDLLKQGILLEDTPDGTIWKKV